MTEDTKRALEILQPLASSLGYGTLQADDNFLYVADKAIGISCNSTYATEMEFIGFLFMYEYAKRFRDIGLASIIQERIARYFFDLDQVEKIVGHMTKEKEE